MTTDAAADVDMTRLCADAMNIEVCPQTTGRWYALEGWRPYEPLVNDAQAMALVKRFALEIVPPIAWTEGLGWCARTQTVTPSIYVGSAHNPDLNRAIVECVAEMQRKSVHA